MSHLTIKLHACTAGDPCPLCGRGLAPVPGPRLCLSDREAAVCNDCGKKHAPSLAALVDLAGVAERVGRIGRHTLVPPMTALLDLARAAEHYADCKPHALRRAA